MKVNSMMVVMAVAIVGSTSGCCWLGCESSKKECAKSCEKQCGVGVKANVGWAELAVSLKANVYKGFHIGFSVRYRARLNMTKHNNSEPYYTPGFGKGKTNLGVMYNLTYQLPF